MSTTTASDWLTVAEYAALMRVHPETIRRQLRAGTLPAVQVGAQYRIARPK